jgi:hypothetical protein
MERLKSEIGDNFRVCRTDYDSLALNQEAFLERVRNVSRNAFRNALWNASGTRLRTRSRKRSDRVFH